MSFNKLMNRHGGDCEMKYQTKAESIKKGACKGCQHIIECDMAGCNRYSCPLYGTEKGRKPEVSS